jgi:membrane-bound lytic murein transglycosylase A
VRTARVRFAAVALTALLAACTTSPKPAPARPHPAVAPPRPVVQTVPVAALPGWDQENHLAALDAYARGCGVGREDRGVCTFAQAMMAAARYPTPSEARRFFETSGRRSSTSRSWPGPPIWSGSRAGSCADGRTVRPVPMTTARP